MVIPEPREHRQRWDAPTEPGPEVTKVADRYGQVFERQEDGWYFTGAQSRYVAWSWSQLFYRQAPLTDASEPVPVEETPK